MSLLLLLTPTNPKLATLTDDFATKDLAKWNWGAGASVSGGQLLLPAASAFDGFVSSNAFFDLTGSEMVAEMVQAPNVGNGTVRMFFAAYVDSINGNALRFWLQGGNLNAYQVVGGSETWLGFVAYNATDHRWLRIRESAGLVYWDVSPADRSSWTNVASWTPTFPVTSVVAFLSTGYTGTEPSPGTAIFDNFNVAPPAIPSGTGTGTVSTAGAASGARTPKGSGTGAATFTGTAAGKRVAKGAATGTVTTAGTAVGKRTPRATGTGAVTTTGTAAGTTVRSGSGSGTVSTTGAASGSTTRTGAATGTVSTTGTGAGTRAPVGSATGTVAVTGSGTGVAPAVNDGSGAGTVTVTGTASGTRSPVGTGSGAVTTSGTGTGSAPVVGGAAGSGTGAVTVTGTGTGTGGEPSTDRDITLHVGAGQSRALTVSPGRSTVLTFTPGPPRRLVGAGQSRTLTATPTE